jgi:hypothetical protein
MRKVRQSIGAIVNVGGLVIAVGQLSNLFH